MHCTCTLHFLPRANPGSMWSGWNREKGERERGRGKKCHEELLMYNTREDKRWFPGLYFTNMSFLEMQVPPLGKYIHLKLSLAQMIKSTGTRPKCPHNSSSSTSNNSSNSSNGSNVLRELSSRLVLPPPLSTSYYSFLLLSARLALPRTARSILANIQEVAATHRAKPRVPTPRRARTNVRRAW